MKLGQELKKSKTSDFIAHLFMMKNTKMPK